MPNGRAEMARQMLAGANTDDLELPLGSGKKTIYKGVKLAIDGMWYASIYSKESGTQNLSGLFPHAQDQAAQWRALCLREPEALAWALEKPRADAKKPRKTRRDKGVCFMPAVRVHSLSMTGC